MKILFYYEVNMNEPMTKDRLIQNLKDAGCSPKLREAYLDYGERGCDKMQLCLLAKQRAILLDKIHREQKKLDCLDYLVYQLKKQEAGCGPAPMKEDDGDS